MGARPDDIKLKAFDQKVIYIYKHLDVISHQGWLKVGETKQSRITGKGTNMRILEQNTAANVAYEVLYTTNAVRNNGTTFSDRDIHNLLVAMDIEREQTINPETKKQSEWFKTDLKTIINVIEEYKMRAVKDEYGVITNFELRDEQKDAIHITKNYYNTCKEDINIEPIFLWNAKPRFGKTLTAYSFAAEVQARKVLIVTNRPAIADSWYTDFKKFDFKEKQQEDGRHRWVFTCSSPVRKRLGNPDDIFTREEQNYLLLKDNFIHFISLQDIKGRSKGVDDFKDKNKWIFDLDWDLVIIDESHEGIDTAKALRTFDNMNTGFTLHLSGTPFKAIANQKFNSEQIYNWSYQDEQNAKQEWSIQDGQNPYADLPKMHIFTYQLSRILETTVEEARDEGSEYAFDLSEFFRVIKENGKDRFAYEDKVKLFVKNLRNSNFQYPFSNDKFRESLRHTFWLLPGVKACHLMKAILLEDEWFKQNYDSRDIIVAASNGDEDRLTDSALAEVRSRIGEVDTNKHPLETRTITLSCGQLTTGVTIPAWTAVLMLNNCKSPSLYMQSAFRAQNPFKIATAGGECFMKENCFVFDFAPDRILQTLAEIADSGVSDTPSRTREEKVKILINFLPVIAEDTEGRMKYLDANEVLTIPLRLITEEVVNRGFMSNRLFKNISGIFGCPQDIKDIIDKMDEAKGKNVERDQKKKSKVTNTPKVWVDAGKKIHINEDIVVATTNGLLGDKKYVEIGSDDGKEVEETIGEAISQARANGYSTEAIKAVKTALTKKMPKLVIKVPDPEPQPGEEGYVELPEKPDEKPKPKEKTDEEKVRDRLRGFARTIPSFLMAYGSADTKLENFGDDVPDDVFEELASITKEDFRKLRDGMEYETKDENGNPKTAHFEGLFDEAIFNSSVQTFNEKRKELACYYKTDSAEDIFEYIPPQANNQIFTPKKVVVMMVDMLEKENPKIFKSTTNTFIDLYMKSGMFITEIVKRIFDQTRDRYDTDTACITHILENQVFGFAPTPILDAITKNYIFGFDPTAVIDQSHFVQYDAIDATKNGTLPQEIKRIFNLQGGDMKFTAVIGNPPYHYETGRRKIPLYQNFMMVGSEPSFTDSACFVTPDGFVKGGQQLEPLREHLVKNKHLKCVTFRKDAIFPGVAVDAAITVFDNKNEFDSPRKTIVYSDGEVEVGTLDWKYRDVIVDNNKYKILEMFELLIKRQGSNLDAQPGIMSDIIPGWAPFGLNTKCYKSNLGKFKNEKDDIHNVRILVGEEQDFYWINPNDDFSYEGSDGRIEFVKLEKSEKWKMVFPKAGLVNEKPLPTRILAPGEIFTDKYLCIFVDSEEEAKNAEKYFNSRFYRAGLDSKMTSWNLYRQWHGNIPVQDFTNNSDIDWNKTINEIDEQLFKKYNFTDREIKIIKTRIK